MNVSTCLPGLIYVVISSLKVVYVGYLLLTPESRLNLKSPSKKQEAQILQVRKTLLWGLIMMLCWIILWTWVIFQLCSRGHKGWAWALLVLCLLGQYIWFVFEVILSQGGV